MPSHRLANFVCTSFLVAVVGVPHLAAAQASARVPTRSALAEWLLASPRPAHVKAHGRFVSPLGADPFAMTGSLTWVVERRGPRFVLDQRGFSAWTGDIAPAPLASLWVLPELDPVFDDAWMVLGTDRPAEMAARVRTTISQASGEPSGAASTFEALLSDNGQRLTAGDFFVLLAAWPVRPRDGEPRITRVAPTTATPFGVLDVPTTHSFTAHDHVPCDAADAHDQCIDFAARSEPDSAALAVAVRALPHNPLPPDIQVTSFAIFYEVRMVVRPTPLAVVSLETTRRTRMTIREPRARTDRELNVSESTYTITFD